VSPSHEMENRFNGFSTGQLQSRAGKPLKRLCLMLSCNTGLKPGANERLSTREAITVATIQRFNDSTVQRN